MTAIWEGRWAEMLRRVLAKRERTELSAIDDLMPVLPVLDPAALEYRLPRRERTWGQQANITPTAGQFAVISLENPAGSQSLVVVEGFHMWRFSTTGGAAATCQPGNSLGAGVASVGGFPLDWRGQVGVGSLTSNARVITYDRAGSLDGRMDRFGIDAVFNPVPLQQMPVAVVLPPGAAFHVGCELVSIGVGCNFRWYERAIDPSELGFSGA